MRKLFLKSKTHYAGALVMMLGLGIWGSVVSADSLKFKDVSKSKVIYDLGSEVAVEDNTIVVKYADSDEESFSFPDLVYCYNAYKTLAFNYNKNIEKEEIKKNFDEQRNVYLAEAEEKLLEKTGVSSTPVATANPQYSYYTEDGLTPSGGVNYYGEQKETYYNLNMNNVVNNAHNAGIEGEYWIREDGVKMLGDKVIVAANQDVHPYGSIVETSLGEGIVLDTGGFAAGNPTQVDIATDW